MGVSQLPVVDRERRLFEIEKAIRNTLLQRPDGFTLDELLRAVARGVDCFAEDVLIALDRVDLAPGMGHRVIALDQRG